MEEVVNAAVARAKATMDRCGALESQEIEMLVDAKLELMRTGIELMSEARQIESWEAHAEGREELLGALSDILAMLGLLDERFGAPTPINVTTALLYALQPHDRDQ